MSWVTNVILTCALGDEDRIGEVNEFFTDRAEHLFDMIDGKYAGTKVLEVPIFIGAYNYLDIKSFIFHLRTRVSWEEPALVQVFIKDQEDERFRVIEPFGGRLTAAYELTVATRDWRKC